MTRFRPQRRSTPRAGLALVDLVVTALVVGLLAAAVLPRFSSAIESQRVSAAAQRLCADIRLARRTAISASRSVRIEIDAAQSRYTLVGVGSLDRPGTDYSLQLTTGGYDSRITSASLGGDAVLIFNLHGQPDSGGTIALSSGGAQRTVTINAATGEATSS